MSDEFTRTASAAAPTVDKLPLAWKAGRIVQLTTDSRYYLDNGESWIQLPDFGGGGAFIDLSDVPADYTGEALKFVRVNVGETGLEFAALAGGGDMLAANNLSELADPPTARSNLGLGSAALANTADFLLAANDLSDVSDVSTARVNLGLEIGNDVQPFDATLLNDVQVKTRAFYGC